MNINIQIRFQVIRRNTIFIEIFPQGRKEGRKQHPLCPGGISQKYSKTISDHEKKHNFH